MTLWELKPNQQCKVKNLKEVSSSVSSKIRDLGILESESVGCLQWLPLGGPRVYKLVNGIFALEKSIADSIEVEPCT